MCRNGMVTLDSVMCRCGGELFCLVTVWRRIVNPGYVLVMWRRVKQSLVMCRYRYDVTCPVPVKHCGERVGVAEQCLGEAKPRGVKELLSLEMLRAAEL